RITIAKAGQSDRLRDRFACMKHRFWTPALACTAIWQLCALVMVYPVGGFLFVWIFEPLFVRFIGPIQTNNASFARMSLYLGYFLVTAPATYICVRLFDRLRKVITPRKSR